MSALGPWRVATGTPAGVGYSVIHNNGDTVNRIIISTFVTAVAIAAASSSAEAQRSQRVQSTWNPWQIGGAAGIAFPTGDLGSFTGSGFDVTVAVGYQPRNNPIGIRGEAAYNEFGFEGGGGNVNITGFTGNLIYTLPGISYSPYVIGGAGLYRVNVDPDGPAGNSDNHFGFNIGGGIKLPLSTSFETFVEARYHHVPVNGGSYGFIPITIGIMW
jgi:Outer membrane protein beta-barrel domain